MNQVSAVNETEAYGDADKYDGPGLAAQFEFDRTMDPATGTVPRERYMLALQRTIESKEQNANLIGGLPWIERGPNSDLYGPFGNSRANNDITSGRIRAMMVDSSDATHKTVFIGGVCGGLWKTTDITASPASWSAISDNLSNLAIAAICQDPRPGFQNIMYFCTGESYHNADAVQGNGVFKSTDYGETWSYLPSTSSYVNGTRILCDYQGNIYLATRGTGLLRSTAASGGVAWTNITPATLPNPNITDMEISSTSAAGRLHVTCGTVFFANGYRFTDVPATVTSAAGWTASTTALPSFTNRIEIACSGSTLYALPANNDPANQVPVIYKSTNGGVDWVSTGGVPSATWAANQGWYALAVDIDPSNSNSVIIGGLDTWKSTNAGANWTQLSTWVGTSPVAQYVHADIHKIIWLDGGNKLIIASDGGVFYSGDKGVTFRDRNKGLRIKQFYSCAIHPSSTNYFLAGAQDNGVHQFGSAGLGATTEVTGGDGCFVAIDQLVPNNQFGSYVFNTYRRSTNGGTNWSGVNFYKGTSASAFYFGSFVNAWDYDNANKVIYAGGDGGEFFRWTTALTTPSGDYFASTGFPAGASILSSITGFGAGKVTAVTVSPFTANRVYFGTDGGRVVYIDGANTAASGTAGTNITGAGFPVPVGLNPVTVSCINTGTNDQNLICCFSNYGVNSVWVSSNGGTSWTSLDNNGVNLPDMPVRWCMFYPGDNTKAFIATETGVWQTDLINGTSTVWNANSNFPAVRTDMIKYRSSDRTLAAATHGRGLWTAILPNVATPDLSFQSATDAASEITAFTNGCRGYTDYTKYMVIANSPTGAATVTLSDAGGSTATQGVDYDITTNGNFASPSMALNFASGSGTAQPFTIRVYDDAAVESAESFTLNYSTTGGNAQAGATNQTFTFTINDNDAAPVVAGTFSNAVGTYNANFSAQAPFNCTQAKFRQQALFTAAELISAGITTARNFNSMTLRVVTKNSTVPYSGFTISMANTSAANLNTGFISPTFTTVFPATNYSTVTGDNLFTFTTPFAWDGTSNIVINFCYDNASAGATSDITETTLTALGTGIRATAFSNGVVSSPCTSGASFVSDVRIKATFGTSIAGTAVSTAITSSKPAYLGPNDDVYFYDASGNIMARIKNLSAANYGCTQVVIDRAGSSTAPFWNPAPSGYLASKSFKIIPTFASAGSVQVTLYYTNAEVAGYNTAAAPSTFSSAQMVKVSNGYYIPDITPATPHLTDAGAVVVDASTGTYGTAGSTITATFSNLVNGGGFGVGNAGNSALTADYRTKGFGGSGNYSNPASWEYNIFGSSYLGAAQSPTANSNVTIQYPDAITLNASQTINAGKTLTVNGTLKTGINSISGAGNFLLSSVATLTTSNTGTNGLSQNIAVTGSKTFADDVTYTFLGATTAPFGSNFTSVKARQVVIGANVTLDKPLYITNTIGFTGSNRTLTTAGNLTLGSSALNTALVLNMNIDVNDGITALSGNSIAGLVTVERYIANAGHRAWHLLSGIAVTGTQKIKEAWQENGGPIVAGVGTLITSNLYNASNGFDAASNSASILTHNQAGGGSWNYNLANTNSTVLSSNRGYMLFVRGDRNYTTANAPTTSATVLRTNGTLTQGSLAAVTVSASGTGRTLVANPYASLIDMEKIMAPNGVNRPNLDQNFMVWDPALTGNYGVGGFRAVVRTGINSYNQTPVVLGGTVNNDPTIQFIPSGSAFFMHATGSNATLSFTEAVKTTIPNNVYNPIVHAAGDQQIIANLMVVEPGNKESLADGIRVMYNDNYRSTIDDDIIKMGNFTENLSSYREGKKLIVEMRPMITAKDTIFLQMSNTGIKDYRFQIGTIDFVQTGVSAYLEDTYLKTYKKLALDGSINNADFSVTSDAASAAPDRFRIIFSASAASPVNLVNLYATAYGKDIMVNWKVNNQFNVQKFEVEKSTDGIHFYRVNSQPATGFNGSNTSYNWTDINGLPGDNFYRIKMTGIGGEEQWSSPVKITLPGITPSVKIITNPVTNHRAALQFNGMEKGTYQLRLFSGTGQLVFDRAVNHPGGSGIQTLVFDRTIAGGQYRLEISKKGGMRIVQNLVIIE